MKFRRAKFATTAQAVAKAESSTNASLLEPNLVIPEISFDQIIVNKKAKLSRHGADGNGLLISPKRPVFTVLSPNANTNAQQEKISEERRQSETNTKLPARRRRNSGFIPTLTVFSPSAPKTKSPLPKIAATGEAEKRHCAPLENQPRRMAEQNNTSDSEAICSEQLWEYPKVSLPSYEAQKKIHNATKIVPGSHQNQLSTLSKSGLLSLEDVIIPSICFHEERALQKLEKKIRQHCARKYDETPIDGQSSTSRLEYIEESADVQSITACRLLVGEFEKKAFKIVRASRIERETMIAEQLETAKKRSLVHEYVEKQQRLLEEKAEERERRRRQQLADKEKRKIGRKKNYYKNKEMWREVALLMTALSRLEREEKEWMSVEQQLKKKESDLLDISQNPTLLEERVSSLKSDTIAEVADNMIERHSPNVEETLRLAMEDISLSTGRINQSLRDVLQLVENTEAVRLELYRKYTKEHQFRGYLCSGNPNGLIRDVILNGI